MQFPTTKLWKTFYCEIDTSVHPTPQSVNWVKKLGSDYDKSTTSPSVAQSKPRYREKHELYWIHVKQQLFNYLNKKIGEYRENMALARLWVQVFFLNFLQSQFKESVVRKHNLVKVSSREPTHTIVVNISRNI